MKRVFSAVVAWAVAFPASAVAVLAPQGGLAGAPNAPVTATGGGFHWAHAAAGFGVGIGIAILAISGAFYVWQHMSHAPHGPSGRRPTHGTV